MTASLRAVLACLLSLSATTVLAEVRTSERVVVEAGETVEDNLYVFAERVRIQGDVEGDVVIFARQAQIEGDVEGDVLIAAQEVRLEGEISGNVRSAAADIRIIGGVEGDALLAAAQLFVGPTGEVGGEFIAAANTIEIAGPVGGDARVAASNVTVNAPMGGALRASTGELSLLPNASIAGDLVYRSGQDANVAPGVRLEGAVERLEMEEGGGLAAILLIALRLFIGLFALGALFVLLFPRFARQAPQQLETKPWKSVGWGAVVLIGTPLIAMGLFFLGAFIGGWWLGLVLLALYAIALALSVPVAGMAFGEWLLLKVRKLRVHALLALALGLVVLALLSLVPFLNVLVLLAVVLGGLGALVLSAAGNRRALRHRGEAVAA